MNIGKAGAFSNAGGTVVDTFSFTDRYRTLEMNLPAWERFKTMVHDVLSGKRDLKRMLRERLEVEKDQLGAITSQMGTARIEALGVRYYGALVESRGVDVLAASAA